jgi:hypothetical protein
MDGRRSIGAAVALAVCATVAGCGGNDDKGKRSAAAGTVLGNAILAPCAAPQFAKPRIRKLPRSGWSLDYRRVKPPPRGETGASETVLVVEYPPTTPKPAKFDPEAREATIGGRRIAYTEPSSKSPGYRAQWKTDRALYTLIATGTHPASVSQFVSCLP